MLTFSGGLKIFLAVAPCDLRKSFNGLHALVTEHLGEDPRTGALFVFINRRHSRLKILLFDGTGLWVCTTLDALGKAFTVFTVSLQPGDNYRVAAALNTTSGQTELNGLQVDDDFAAGWVEAADIAVLGSPVSVSSMLTVWRKLHLEFDTMAAPPTTSGGEENFAVGTINRANAPVGQPPYRTTLEILHRDVFGPGVNLLERGKLVIDGVPNAITRSRSGGNVVQDLTENRLTTVDIYHPQGPPAGPLVGKPVTVYDDDDQYLADDPLYRSVLNLQSPPLPMERNVSEPERYQSFIGAIRPSFSRAYILPVIANNAYHGTVPFKRNAHAMAPVNNAFDTGNLQLKGKDRAAYWAFSVVFGYQNILHDPVFGEDGDPDTETPPEAGWTPKTPVSFAPWGFAVIYVESIRDFEFGVRPNEPGHNVDRVWFKDDGRRDLLVNRYWDRIDAVIAHELGHGPGRQSGFTDHNEEGIMSDGAPASLSTAVFNPRTVLRFRNTESWTKQ